MTALLAGALMLPVVVGAQAAHASPGGEVLGSAGLTARVDAVRRTGGHLEVQYTLVSHAKPGSPSSGLQATQIVGGVEGVAQMRVLNPVSGVAGELLGSGEDCRCSRLPPYLNEGEGVTAVAELSDPGGATVDVVFSAFHPVFGVAVQGAVSSVTATRVLKGRTVVPLGRRKQGAVRETGQRIDLETDVLFRFGSASLNSKARSSLEVAAAKLKAQPKRQLAVNGHTDGKGSASSNEALSSQRAQAVREALEPLLGSGWSFTVKGLGESKPIASETTESGGDSPAGRALNRRVELSLLG